MTTNPPDLVAVRDYSARVTGQSLAELGIAGDDAHAASGGYHIGGNAVPSSDYSRSESPRDRAVTTSDASAFDLGGNFQRFREITLGIVAACKRDDARARDIREVIYTPDGVSVHRWDRLGIRAGGDDSHLWHTHISFFRDSVGRRDRDDNFLGLLKILIGGDTAMGMATDDPQAWKTLAAAGEMAGYLRDGTETTWDNKPVQTVRLLHQIASGVEALKAGTPTSGRLLTADQIAALGQEISAAVLAAHSALTDADKPLIQDAVMAGVRAVLHGA